jgi:hypothetical protein
MTIAGEEVGEWVCASRRVYTAVELVLDAAEILLSAGIIEAWLRLLELEISRLAGFVRPSPGTLYAQTTIAGGAEILNVIDHELEKQ